MPDKSIEAEQPPPVEVQPVAVQPINDQKSGLSFYKKHTKTVILRIIMIAAAVLIGIVVAACLWYGAQLQPLVPGNNKVVTITIEPGSTPSQIGQLLQDKSVIRSSFAFDMNSRLSGNSGKLRVGTYLLSSGKSTPQIIEHLVSGKVDQFSITFFPGATLTDTTNKNERKKLDVTSVLLRAGYSRSEISAALNKTYDSPLFAGKPAGTDLEGYVYGQTYNFNAGASVEQILERTFAEFNKIIVENNLVQGFGQQGLTLYKGITMASIIQRETISPNSAEPSQDQKQVAQVFYKRLSIDMPLGSDVTFIYAANKLGVTPISTLDSPYNTRIVTGLPPGPVASPGVSALRAAASPAATDFLYFVAGDDGQTYFGQTLEEHEANVAAYCTIECDKP
ncbi:endolytic transglycosylase MltG [Candidatus Saccharibacteria bacterium]|nr:endolytic transglycosylase MltG [Candidatus Saccharibacteria bacterium]